MKEGMEKPIDVIKSSPLEEAVELIKSDKEIFSKDVHAGHFYAEKDIKEYEDRQNINIERFVVFLSKGVLHVSDIIKKDGKYYSRLNYTEESSKGEEGEIEAEMFLVRYVFGDWDKSFIDPDIQDNIYTKGKQFAHFDYGEAFRNTSKPNSFFFTENENPLDFKERINFLLDNPILVNREDDYYKRNIDEGKPYTEDYIKLASIDKIERELLAKTDGLTDAIHDKAFFDSVIKKSELDINDKRFSFLSKTEKEEKIEEFRSILLGRLNVLKSVINERIEGHGNT